MNDQGNEERESWRDRERKDREHLEPFLRRLCTLLNIDNDPFDLRAYPVQDYAGMFPGTDILSVSGPDLERPALPSSSYTLVAVVRGDTDISLVELSPRKPGLTDLLTRHWNLLPHLSPKQLADFILTMHTVDTTGHLVLDDVGETVGKSLKDEGYVPNEALNALLNDSLATTMVSTEDQLTIHALTLYGWMHEKQNLGFTEITFTCDGQLEFGERQTVCDPVFEKMPEYWY